MDHDLLFVYGTLRRGQPNHGLLAGSEFVAESTLVGNWGLIDLGAFPGVVPIDRIGRIVGESYRVDTDTLRRTDRLEGHPHLYRRIRLALVDQSVAWVYLFMREPMQPPRIIDGGDWLGRSGPPCRFP